MSRRKMGSMGKLSQFSGIKSESATPSTPPTSPTPPTPNSSPDASALEKVPLPAPTTEQQEKLVTINIKISRSQHEWLSETARTVRENNSEPVPPQSRVFPQHLIGVALDLLASGDVDWSQVKNVSDLRQQLGFRD